MMRSLLDLPARADCTLDLADWAEISAFFHDDRSISEEDLVRALVRGGDAGKAEHAAREMATEAFNELSTRETAIGNSLNVHPHSAYPYAIDGPLLKLSVDPFSENNPGLLYAFLLAITRASMDSGSRRMKGIDPTLLFEELCADVLCRFWGGSSDLSGVFVTGTSNKDVPLNTRKRFQKLIGALAGHIEEFGGWKDGAKSPGAGDGGLDMAVWRKFRDKRPGNLIGFAQCKTGDHWKDHLGRRNPESICHRFFRNRVALSPLAIYMVPCRVSEEEWEEVMLQHRGLLFDRCRIVNFGMDLAPRTLKKCASWLEAALTKERKALVSKLAIPATAGVAS
ncbi:MAG: hypothetical protein ACREHD_21215 [Pirellulales bacterium]